MRVSFGNTVDWEALLAIVARRRLIHESLLWDTMEEHDADLAFPNCCACCPYLQAFKASCTHDLRQSLVQDLSRNQSCPVYSREKTTAMQRLNPDN